MPDGSTDHAVTRFAPSPTGHLHIGGARSALFCWAFARNVGGRFMIRIEDTDQARSSDESARGILDDLAWLGIEWDDGPTLAVTDATGAARFIGGQSREVGPYFQAQRVPMYDAYIESLVRKGRAYPAFEAPEDLEAKRKAATAAKQTYRYERPSDVRFGVFNEGRWQRALAGERHVIRFAMDDQEVIVHDRVLGDVRLAPGEVDDFVIRKADGFPTYHFAVVIDDELMGVTHVMRAQEHLINTPRHVALQRALTRLKNDRDVHAGDTGTPFRTPVYGHMPIIANADGSKMSKRDKAKAARKYLKDAMGKQPSMSANEIAMKTGVDEKQIADFIAGETDTVEIATAVARAYALTLPEIEIWDFRASGYLPEVITNYIALLGWSPGQKNADGTDVDKFDLDYIAKHFSLERIGKSPAKFDRVKLLAFNADAIQKLSDDAFLTHWLRWLGTYEPSVAAAIGAFDRARQVWMVQAIKPRAKTLADGHKPVSFALLADDAVAFDPAAVQKVLRGPASPASKEMPPTGLTGLDVLRAAREVIAGVGNGAEPAAIDGTIGAFAAERGLSIGATAQPLRVALTGTTVSPGLGHCVAILGTDRTLARIERCLAAHA